MLRLANTLSENFQTNNPEALRETPIFPSDQELQKWLDDLLSATNQVNLIKQDLDIQLKTDTYASIEDVYQSTRIVGNNTFYASAYSMAKSRGLIGNKIGSCETQIETSFEKFMQNSLVTKELRCTCPVCKKKVNAPIKDGKIHCPKCNSSAIYEC